MKKKEKDRPLEDRLLYKIIFIPKKEELQKFKGIVFFDFSYHVEEFMGPIGEKIKENVEQNPEGKFIELKKNEPKNYNLAIKELNKTFEKYFGKEELSQKEQKIIETIKRDGITIIGDLAITDPNKVFEPEEFKNFLKNCSRLKEDGIKIRFLVIAPEKFTYNYKGQKRENTIEQRIEEFYNIEGMEKKKEERREGLEYYRLAYENNSIEIVYINSDEKKLEDLEKALKYFIK
ncbi:MAG: hypothetical protein N3D10_03180 [Candidatus Micrarchaeota archaeon]|nr:hypothetical protein [Candidatus Micrarchaeota archaeon]